MPTEPFSPANPTRITLPSVAKLNLFLHINGKRADGYHELQTYFQFIDLADSMTFTMRDEGFEFTCTDSSIANSHNLVVKAHRLLCQHIGRELAVAIHLEKRLPMGGGIGGGSSNAATTLLALNALFGLNLSQAVLLTLAKQLGADVPIFVHGQACLADGIGEQFTPYTAQEAWYLLVHPHEHVSTAALFSHSDLPRNTAKRSLDELDLLTLGNDFEPLVKKLYPKVENTLSWLVEYAPSKMTGTGACCFARFTSQQDALNVLTQLPIKWSGYICRGYSISPTHSALAAIYPVNTRSEC